MIKQYDITLDSALPSSKTMSFTDVVEEGIFVVKTEDDIYYISRSNFIAKTLRHYKYDLFGKDVYLQEHKPKSFVAKYLLGTSRRKVSGLTPESRASHMYAKDEFQFSVYLRFCEKYGVDNVRNSNHKNYGVKGFENITEYVNSFLNTYDYKKLMELEIWVMTFQNI